MARKPSKRRKQALAEGYASGFELDIAEDLKEKGEDFGYEEQTFELWLPVHRGHQCAECGHGRVLKRANYTPDFFLSNGIIVESKGRFTALDRRKAMAIVEQYDVDYRLVFEYDNKLSRSAKQRYSEWCEKQGIKYAIKRVPTEWLSE